MKSWLVALRIARREARRAKGRTILVVAMITMPVLALSFAAVAYDMMKLTPAESRARVLGSATGRLQFSPPDSVSNVKPPTTADLQNKAPSGVRVSPTFSDSVAMHTATGVGTLSAYGIDTTDPMTKGLVRTISGRTPTADNEVAVSPSALTRLGAHIGDTVSVLVRDGETGFPEHTYKVVGIVEISGQIEQDVLFRPSQGTFTTDWLYSSPKPLTADQVMTLTNLYAQPMDMNQLAGQPTATVRGFNVFGIGTIITGLGILEVVLLAGPAFAVGAKRRQRDLALAAANGANPATVRRMVLGDGVVAGAVAGVVGISVGIAGAFLSRGLIEDHLTHVRAGGYRVDAPMLILIAAIAIVTGVLGALVPAYTVGRQDVVVALSGRRGVTKSRSLWLVIGLLGVASGAGLAYLGAQRHSSNYVLAGLITGELGIVLCTPKLVGLVARAGRLLPVTPRIALRDTARRRAAAAPAISAVMAAVAGSVALTVYLGASNARDSGYVQTRPTGSISVFADSDAAQKKVIDTVKAAVPGATIVDTPTCDCSVMPLLPQPLRCPFDARTMLSDEQQRQARADKRCNDPFGDRLMISGVDAGSGAGPLLGISGQDLSNASAMLDRGGAVVTDSRFIDSSGHLQLQLESFSDFGVTSSVTTITIPAVAVNAPSVKTVLISTRGAGGLGLKFSAGGAMVVPPEPLDNRQLDALNSALLTAGLSQADVETGPPANKQSVALILAVAAGLIALGAAAIATGLAAADSRRDLMSSRSGRRLTASTPAIVAGAVRGDRTARVSARRHSRAGGGRSCAHWTQPGLGVRMAGACAVPDQCPLVEPRGVAADRARGGHARRGPAN